MKIMDSITLEVVSPFMLDGEMVRKGEVVEVSKREAAHLLHRRKARTLNAPPEGARLADDDATEAKGA